MKPILLCLAILIFALTAAGSAVAQSWNLQELTKEAKALKPADIEGVRARAQSGEAQAQFLLGLAFEFGYAGLTKDPVEALRWFRKAADQGIGLPEAWVGDFYYAGIAGPKDFAEALRWYRRSAEHGYAWGAKRVADMYVFGEGATADHRESAKWFRRAAELGNVASKQSAALFDSSCHDDLCVILRQIVHAALSKQLSRYRGQQKTDLLGYTFIEGTKIFPGAKECRFHETGIGSKTSPAYTCEFEIDPVEPRMTERFNNFVQRVTAALPPTWTGKVYKDPPPHGWLGFSRNPPLSDEQRKELDFWDWMGWEPLVKVRLTWFSYFGTPSAHLGITVRLDEW
ncbi:MAG: tetratricopeptide repeat protein [Acidobacteriota bacterium]